MLVLSVVERRIGLGLLHPQVERRKRVVFSARNEVTSTSSAGVDIRNRRAISNFVRVMNEQLVQSTARSSVS